MWLFQFGIKPDLKPYEKRRALIFNYANTAGFGIALIRLVYMAAFSDNRYSAAVFVINALPLLIFVAMAGFMHTRRYRGALATSFVFFPPAITLLKLPTQDKGIEMYFIVYLMFAFFFLYRRVHIALAVGWILVCWTATVLLNETPAFTIYLSPYPLDAGLTVINYSTAFALTLLTMYFIKFEVWKYEQSIRKQKEELTRLNAIKDKVFSVISHDLRTPVLSTIMLLKAMERGEFTDQQFRELLPELRDNMEETGELMTNLLVWARNQIRQTDFHASYVSLTELSAQTVRFLNRQAEEKNIRLVNEIPEGCTAYADRDSLQIVLRNLVANAIKFTASGGYVRMRSASQKGMVKVSVEDNGVGISTEDQDLLFGDGFYTTEGTAQEKGTGMGLFLCRDIIEKNGGAIFFASEEGRGTTFTFSVPAQAASTV